MSWAESSASRSAAAPRPWATAARPDDGPGAACRSERFAATGPRRRRRRRRPGQVERPLPPWASTGRPARRGTHPGAHPAPGPPRHRGVPGTGARLPEVIGLFVTSGTHDFLLRIAVPDVDGVYAFDRLTERRGSPTCRPPGPMSTSSPAASSRTAPIGPASHAGPADR
ncbi:Lrp/AsnC ligand binding domain-containing protein [Streptomyces atroolivaceus]|uniref:Lrp/AsnC ligand binding domain-containing protein n=1 Tax=Streptomyces atroolivaceus TaxID=66869 RepID=UPI00362D22EA